MLVAERFVYVHLPKTGGTFVRQVLRDLLERLGAWYLDSERPADRAQLGEVGHHGAVRDRPPGHRDKPVLCSIRNPYDWYVSHYEFGWWRTKEDAVFDDAAMRDRYGSYPELSFGEFLEAFNDCSLWPPAEREGVALEQYAGVGALTASVISTLAVVETPATHAAVERLREEGFASALFPELHFLRTDTLSESLRDFLIEQGFPPAGVAHVGDLGRIYPREGGRDPAAAWADYYDGETKAFVRAREAVLFELFPAFDV